jgi:hypothetical protein
MFELKGSLMHRGHWCTVPKGQDPQSDLFVSAPSQPPVPACTGSESNGRKSPPLGRLLQKTRPLRALQRRHERHGHLLLPGRAPLPRGEGVRSVEHLAALAAHRVDVRRLRAVRRQGRVRRVPDEPG